jgi:putative hydrolase of the HAD superfamily
MGTPISWLLFDADGVLQRSPDGWRRTLDGLLGDDPDSTLAELFTLEQEQSLTGRDFRELVVSVLRRRGVSADPERVLDCWRLLEVDTSMIGRIRQLRRGGIRCGLATNQQNVRIEHMRSMPEYAGLFDAKFYSAELGLAKPDPAYFAAIVRQLSVAPEDVLFVDDKEDNVLGARAAGLRAEVFAVNGGAAELDRILTRYDVAIPA